MKKVTLVLFFAVVSIAAACKKDQNRGDAYLSLQFKANFDGSPLVLYQDYTAPDGNLFQMTVLNFFLSELEIVAEDGTVVQLADHEFVDFKLNVDATTADQGVVLTFDKLPAGNYKEIRMGVGVAPSLNATTPSDHSSSTELGNAGNYWSSWSSYIFSRTEGRIDTLPSAAGGLQSFMYHSGVDGTYRPKTFSHSFVLTDETTANLQFNLDLKDVFYLSGAEIDIAASPVSHSGDPGTDAFQLVSSIVENIANALVIQ